MTFLHIQNVESDLQILRTYTINLVTIKWINQTKISLGIWRIDFVLLILYKNSPRYMDVGVELLSDCISSELLGPLHSKCLHVMATNSYTMKAFAFVKKQLFHKWFFQTFGTLAKISDYRVNLQVSSRWGCMCPLHKPSLDFLRPEHEYTSQKDLLGLIMVAKNEGTLRKVIVRFPCLCNNHG